MARVEQASRGFERYKDNKDNSKDHGHEGGSKDPRSGDGGDRRDG